jgi:hypothetical protein
MPIMITYVSPEQKLLMDKVEKVILSCKTKEQLKGAYEYYKLWEKKEDWGLNKVKNINLNMKAMLFIGLIHGMSKFTP